MNEQIVTAWYKDGEYNHLSIGFHPDHYEPAYMSEGQRKAWLNAAWTPREAILSHGVLTIV